LGDGDSNGDSRPDSSKCIAPEFAGTMSSTDASSMRREAMPLADGKMRREEDKRWRHLIG
jgi:hypothetical protein